MVFGDGDGTVFRGFTSSLTVIGHELTHGVTQYSANLTYEGQSGALNESISDVFGALVEQYSLGQSADEASWLIGAGLFTDQVQGTALRSMKAPRHRVRRRRAWQGSAAGRHEALHRHGGRQRRGAPQLRHPQSGVRSGGHRAGRQRLEEGGPDLVRHLTGGAVPVDCDFRRFAAATTDAAPPDTAPIRPRSEAVAAGWKTVG